MATPFAKTKAEHDKYAKAGTTHKVYYYNKAIQKDKPSSDYTNAYCTDIGIDKLVNDDTKYKVTWKVPTKVWNKIQAYCTGFNVQVRCRRDFVTTDDWKKTTDETVGSSKRSCDFEPDPMSLKLQVKIIPKSSPIKYQIITYTYTKKSGGGYTEKKSPKDYTVPHFTVDPGYGWTPSFKIEPTDSTVAPNKPDQPEVISNKYNEATGYTEMKVRVQVENPENLNSIKVFGKYIKCEKLNTLAGWNPSANNTSSSTPISKLTTQVINEPSKKPVLEVTFQKIPDGVYAFFTAQSVSKYKNKNGKAYTSDVSDQSKMAASMLPSGTAIGGYVQGESNIKVMYEPIKGATNYIIEFSPSLEELFIGSGPTYGTYTTGNPNTMAYINPNNNRDMIYMRYAGIAEGYDITPLDEGSRYRYYPIITRTINAEGGFEYHWGGVKGDHETVNDSKNPITASLEPDYPNLWSLYSTRKINESVTLYATNNSRTGAPARTCEFHLDYYRVFADGSSDTSPYASLTYDVDNDNRDLYGNIKDGPIPYVADPTSDMTFSDDEMASLVESFSYVRLVWYAIITDTNGFTSPSDCPAREILFFPEPTVSVSIADSTLITDEDESYYRISSYPIKLNWTSHPSGQKPIGYYLTITSNDTYQRELYYGSDDTEIVLQDEVMYNQYITPTDIVHNTENYPIDPGMVIFETGHRYTISVSVTMETGLTSQPDEIVIEPWFNSREYTIGYQYDSDTEDCICDITPWCIDYKEAEEGSATLTNSVSGYDFCGMLTSTKVINTNSFGYTMNNQYHTANAYEVPFYVTGIMSEEFVLMKDDGNYIFANFELSLINDPDEYGIATYSQNGVDYTCLLSYSKEDLKATLDNLSVSARDFDLILVKVSDEDGMYRSVNYNSTTDTMTYTDTYTVYEPDTEYMYVSSATNWTDNKILVSNYDDDEKLSPILCSTNISAQDDEKHRYVVIATFNTYVAKNSTLTFTYDYASSNVYVSDPSSDMLSDDAVLSVYRINADRTTTLIESNIPNDRSTTVTDYHPSLRNSMYRIVAMSTTSGDMSVIDTEPETIDEIDIVIQWGTRYKLVTNDDGEISVEEDYREVANTIKIPYNIDVNENTSIESELVKYIGRERPVAYYGTMRNETPSFNFEIVKSDTETLSRLRALSIYPGNVYIREPSGLGYWCNVQVSWGITHCELTIPVTINAVPVEGGR